jgi:hypothetical protein
MTPSASFSDETVKKRLPQPAAQRNKFIHRSMATTASRSPSLPNGREMSPKCSRGQSIHQNAVPSWPNRITRGECRTLIEPRSPRHLACQPAAAFQGREAKPVVALGKQKRPLSQKLNLDFQSVNLRLFSLGVPRSVWPGLGRFPVKAAWGGWQLKKENDQ